MRTGTLRPPGAASDRPAGPEDWAAPRPCLGWPRASRFWFHGAAANLASSPFSSFSSRCPEPAAPVAPFLPLCGASERPTPSDIVLSRTCLAEMADRPVSPTSHGLGHLASKSDAASQGHYCRTLRQLPLQRQALLHSDYLDRRESLGEQLLALVLPLLGQPAWEQDWLPSIPSSSRSGLVSSKSGSSSSACIKLSSRQTNSFFWKYSVEL